jgi:hypothetical protein
MFEHLDDDAAALPPEGGARLARREARYRKNRRTSIVATSCLLLGALMAVAVRGNTPQPPPVRVAEASANSDSTTLAPGSNQRTKTTAAPARSTADGSGTDIGSGSGPGSQPSGTGTTDNTVEGADPGTTPVELGAGSGASTDTTPDTVAEPGIVEWIASAPVTRTESGNGVELTFSLEIRNGTDQEQVYQIDWCDKIFRWKVDEVDHTVEPDYNNCEGEGGPETVTVAAGQSFTRSQPAVIKSTSGSIPNGTWDFVIHDKFHVTLTVYGSPQ